MTLDEMMEAASKIANEHGPAVALDDATLIVIVADKEGWSYALRGDRRYAIIGLENALNDARLGDGFKHSEVVTA